MKSSETIGALAEALAKAQGAFPAIAKDKTAKIASAKGNYTYDYADLASVLDAVRPTLAANGLAVVQSASTEGPDVAVVTRLVHASGEWIESDPVKVACNSTRPQDVGSAITYARRYSIAGILGVAPEADDDGNVAQGTSATTQPRKSGLTLGDAVGSKPAAPAGEPVYVAEAEVRKLVARALAIPEPYTITKKDFADMCGPSASAVTPDSFEVMQALVEKREAKAREASEG